MSEYTFREYQAGDEASILELFNLVFRGEGTGVPPRTRAEWAWQFLENPGGWRMWLAVHDGQVVAQQAGIGYRARVEGRDAAFSQTVDSMVHPAHRSGLKNPGLFVQTGMDYVKTYGGPRDMAFIGWPNYFGRRIGKAFLGYRIVRSQTLLGRPTPPGSSELPAGVRRLEAFGPSVRALYDRCARDWKASIVRDELYLNWRFRDHPQHTYELLAVEDADGTMLGYAVGRYADWPIHHVYSIVDWLVAPDREDVEAALRAAVEAAARRHRAEAVLAMFPEWSEWFQRFQRAGYLVWPSECFLGTQVHVEGYDVDWIRWNLWVQLSESDYV